MKQIMSSLCLSNKQYTQRSYNKRTTLYYVPNKQYTRYKHLIMKKQMRNNIWLTSAVV